jgi:glycosyltransferase involved in cell wall biosynthesis
MTSGWPACPPVLVTRGLPRQPEPSRVRVLHVITRFTAGAGGNTLLSATGMDPRRYEVWIAGCPGGPLWQRARDGGVRTVELDGFTEVISPAADLKVLVDLVRLIRRIRPAVVHTHSAKGGVLGRLAASICNVPVVIHTFHGFSVHPAMSRKRRFAYLLMERSVVKRTHAFAAVAPRVAREAVELRLAPPGTVTVVPSAVVLSDIETARRPDLVKILGLDGPGPVIGTVGRIDSQKVPLDFVRTAAAVQRHRPDAHFVMIGDGPLQADVEREAARLGARVHLTGHRDDAPQLAVGFDAYLVTSSYEGLGRALTEALASARPVVATAVNGIPDLVHPGATGLLVEPGDIDAMAASLIWMLEHPGEATAMGRAGQARVLGHFTPERMCADLDALYSRMLGLPLDSMEELPVSVAPPALEVVQ